MHSYAQCALTYTFPPASRDLISPRWKHLGPIGRTSRWSWCKELDTDVGLGRGFCLVCSALSLLDLLLLVIPATQAYNVRLSRRITQQSVLRDPSRLVFPSCDKEEKVKEPKGGGEILEALGLLGKGRIISWVDRRTGRNLQLKKKKKKKVVVIP